MLGNRWLVLIMVLAAAGWNCPCAHAGDLKIPIPRRSKLTPVQRLNREGVEAIRKHNYSKAEELFYRAYLFDPDDPFTLNNLGYISELRGQIDRAQRFYVLAGQQPSEAVVDIASTRSAAGRTLKDALADTGQPLRIDHANVEAVRLLSEGRATEADLLLEDALRVNPQNVFTLNNMGVAKEMEGDDQAALRFYDQAARANSDATAVVAVDSIARGRRVSEIAAESAKGLRARLARAEQLAEQVAELNLQGVSAVNRNDLKTAEADFRKAYALDPYNAFALNNIGYVAELDGDHETAEFFYERAREMSGGQTTVGVATRRSAEGLRLAAVAAESESSVGTEISHEHESVLRQREPVVLRRRDNSIVNESTQPPAPVQTPR